MADESPRGKALTVPASRLARLSRFGTMTAGIAGGVAWRGARAYAGGARPDWQGLLLTPDNLRRVADELARMRGAAMKVGQLVSMDAGDVLPPELAEIMGRLRAEADYMPPKQLRGALDAAWGPGWTGRFERFDVRPLAAASIGQVHRARARGGRDLAIKVQYPGVRRSIDSDVENVAALIRWAGLAPPGMDLRPLLAEAKRQLHEEADYAREGQELARFGALLAGEEDYAVPRLADDLTTRDVLAMSFEPGVAVERMAEADQAERDRIVRLLLELLFREMFEFGVMQTDPNFANYRWDGERGRLVLLDFGATRAFPQAVTEGYRDLLRAGIGGDAGDIACAALRLGFFAEDTAEHHKRAVVEMTGIAFGALRHRGPFDFGNADMVLRLRDRAMEMSADRTFVHVPPTDVFYLQRKFAGLYLLARRLGARVDVGAIAAHWL
ncbi:AarF/ABC1/UbiB kinase family protein [Rhodovulum sp. 12E13]|uniref:ABC1 kinase family protein n=1 Tax=Rhodovulum sp. 12E13 TaxID=2203891 RepID=UPI000E13D12F|nr:AarF/ABC1/UbiB kinase family protein [Rhodovulum sp. 12E13]RDC74940.1 AarF/ABC1/UbiB kinase family protein [Rhodovulum sp. 12E13]